MLLADNLAKAFIGVGSRCGQPNIAVYSVKKCIDSIVEDLKEGPGLPEGFMSEGETYESMAYEYFEYNIRGAWVGEETPVWVDEMTIEEYLEPLDDECKDIIEEIKEAPSDLSKEYREKFLGETVGKIRRIEE